jgi:preprotein translocase subunit SecF
MNFFKKKNYSKLLIIPIVVLVIFLILIFVFPGIQKGIDLKGGNQIIVHYDDQKDFSSFETALKENYNLSEIKINEVRSINEYGLLIEFSLQADIEIAKDLRSKIDFENDLDLLKTEINAVLTPLVSRGFLEDADIVFIETTNNKEDLRLATNEALMLANNNFYNQITTLLKTELNLEEDAKIQTREIAPTLGKDFVNSSIKVGLVAFVLLLIVILLFFREIVPSGLIIFAVIFDVFAALAGMAIFNIPLSLTTIPALLMLIGYSVDTDILLSTRVLKDVSKDPFDSANSSILTGLTMTFTTMATILVMLIVSYLTQMLVIYEISIILFCGLVGDLISTWFFNAPALIKYAEKKAKH